MKKTLHLTCVFAIVAGVVLSAPAPAASQEVVIIANKSVETSTLSPAQLKEIFLGKCTRWENGDKINIVILKHTDTHKSFLKTYVKRSPSQFTNYWRKQVFTGKGESPKAFKSERELVDYVANVKGAIGYITKGTHTDRVKILSVE